MFRGFQTAASGMIAQQRRTEMLTNNMANANTPGFKAEQSTIRSFPEMYMSSLEATRVPTENGLNLRGYSPVGPISTGVYMQETLPLFMQGQLMSTGLPTDMALVDGRLPVDEASGVRGAIFYTLQGDDGTQLYTKNGNFTLDAAGFLTNPTGHYVLDTNGERIGLQAERYQTNQAGNFVLDANGNRIPLPFQNDDFHVTDAGVIMNGQTAVATLGIGFSARPDTLLKTGNGLFATENGENLVGANAAEGVTYSVKQGYLEGSNVDSAQTMTEMLTAYRAFEANQKILQAYDRSMEKAVNEIGRVN